MAERKERAVVLGGSIAGLLTARVLADLFADVVIIERDRLPAEAGHRRGVPQGKQIHALLAGGQRVLEELLPGLTSELAAEGVPVVDALADLRLSFQGRRLRQASSGLTHVSVSRPLLEHLIRQRVRNLPNISVMDGSEVIGLVGHGDRVSGVRFYRRSSPHAEEELEDDLVVDASGRGSRTSAWLTQLGYRTPPVERIRIDLGYTTRRFRLPADVFDGDVGVLHSPTFDQPRGAALARLENNIWMLTLVGMQSDRPPSDVDGFAAFAASVNCDEIQMAVRYGEPIDDPISFRFPASVRRRYERVGLPWNLVVVGDSLCSFNPVYGQGMTVAALEARALGERLSDDGDPSGNMLMTTFARIVDVPWQLAKAADRPFHISAKANRRRGTILDRYVERVLTTATHDPVAGGAFLRVSGLLDPPRTLFQPDVLWRTLRPQRTFIRAHGSTAQPPRAAPVGVGGASARWLFAVIVAAALLKPVLILAGGIAAASWVGAMLRRRGSLKRSGPVVARLRVSSRGGDLSAGSDIDSQPGLG